MDETTRQATRLWTVAMPAVSAFVTAAVRNFRDRDDVLQEIAVAVVESFASYDPQRPFVAWAMGVARNQIHLYYRRCQRERLVFNDAVLTTLADAFTEVGPQQSPRLAFLQDCLRAVEGRARQLLELRYERDLKPAAIAELAGMSANAVAKALQRIRDQLRNCVDRKTAEGLPS